MEHNPLGLSISIRLDSEQYATLNKKLDQILSVLGNEAKLAGVTHELKTSQEALSSAIASDQPQP